MKAKAETPRKWYISEALLSYGRCCEVIHDMTEAEVLAALKLEAASQRRRSLIDRLISRAVRLKEIEYNRQLKEKFYGTPPIENHDSR